METLFVSPIDFNLFQIKSNMRLKGPRSFGDNVTGQRHKKV